MKNKNKFITNQKVRLKSTGETITINKFSYVPNMKRYSYTCVEHPKTFYFEEEIEQLES
ncbi:hypothetical protein JCM9157_4829 [Halalkalibacter akibai JCM 9157]|uniref:Uncharacterized protein n=1 Tax=Halalkalibacter akibai (strain ATCC 43226 / DSM 21942 / CIP 109018 / JCM 9157 / 1139) TaxID=1236973 RepID=W4QZM6_HALA3|nr:hypothetical protein JCM9157_4829 [Halalkalibacter akibai JCM 9157]